VNEDLREIETLLPDDFERHPVWEFAHDHEFDSDTLMRPVERLPVDDLGNRVVGSKVRLNNGTIKWATLCNIELRDIERTEHFRSLSVCENGKWFHLARYHDPDLENNGPEALANFLKLPLEAVFPIVYDIRASCVGDPKAVVASIDANPKKRLTRIEIVKLTVR
jgi:hypothetical protein